MRDAIRPDAVQDGADHQLLPSSLKQELLRALATIRFGSIELVIHDGRIVQLERREKVRFDQQLRPPEG